MAGIKRAYKKLKEVKHPAIERTYLTVMRWECPVRGWVEQVVTVKRYGSPTAPETSQEDEDLKELLTLVEDEE